MLSKKTIPIVVLAALTASCAVSSPQDDSAAQHDTTASAADTLRPRPKFDPEHPWAHDPVVAVEGDTVYAFTTGHGIHQLRSVDMKTWEFDGQCLEALPQWVVERNPEATMHLWAPDIIFAGGEWHVLLAAQGHSVVHLAVEMDGQVGNLQNGTLHVHQPGHGMERILAALRAMEQRPDPPCPRNSGVR